MISHPSPNFEARRDGAKPSLIVLHGTWTDTIEESLGFLTDANPPEGQGRVSAHYLIDRDGTVYSLVDESMRAWHAGESHWRGIDDVNSHSIGIELQNAGMKHILPEPYDKRQIEALIALLQDIIARHNIDVENVLAHSDVAPKRKDDPGEHFPWKALGAAGVAVWPDESRAWSETVNDLLSSEDSLMNAVQGWGYDPSLEPKVILKAFNRRFVPEVFLGGVDDIKTLRAKRLAALWAKKLGI